MRGRYLAACITDFLPHTNAEAESTSRLPFGELPAARISPPHQRWVKCYRVPHFLPTTPVTRYQKSSPSVHFIPILFHFCIPFPIISDIWAHHDMLDKDAFDIEKLRISCNKEMFKIKLNNK